LYIEDNEVTGFIKNYYIPRYKFVAIMPDETTNIDLYVKNWDERKLIKLLEGAINENVKVTFPKFEGGSRIDVKKLLARMGLKQMFSYDANFSGILEDDKTTSIGDIVHASYVVVGKKSSEAKVITEVDNKKRDDSYSKEIVINKPFIYMIYDSEESIPVFIGSVKYIQ
jgi:serpin B